MQKFELSLNWDSKMEGMKINNRDISRQDVEKSLNYFKLRKIKKMFDENQRDFEKAKTYEEQIDLIKIHNVLKEEEQKITRLFGTLIFK
jgi:DNA primase